MRQVCLVLFAVDAQVFKIFHLYTIHGIFILVYWDVECFLLVFLRLQCSLCFSFYINASRFCFPRVCSCLLIRIMQTSVSFAYYSGSPYLYLYYSLVSCSSFALEAFVLTRALLIFPLLLLLSEFFNFGENLFYQAAQCLQKAACFVFI